MPVMFSYRLIGNYHVVPFLSYLANKLAFFKAAFLNFTVRVCNPAVAVHFVISERALVGKAFIRYSTVITVHFAFLPGACVRIAVCKPHRAISMHPVVLPLARIAPAVRQTMDSLAVAQAVCYFSFVSRAVCKLYNAVAVHFTISERALVGIPGTRQKAVVTVRDPFLPVAAVLIAV